MLCDPPASMPLKASWLGLGPGLGLALGLGLAEGLGLALGLGDGARVEGGEAHRRHAEDVRLRGDN